MSIAAAIAEVTRRIAPSVADKLGAARGNLAKLEAERGRVALAAELGEQGAAARLKIWEANVKVASDEVGRLEAAHQAARRRDQAMQAAADVAARREQLNKFQEHATGRVKNAERIGELLAAISKEVFEYREHTGAMVDGRPAGTEFPGGWAGHLTGGESWLSSEMYRHSGVTQIGKRSATLPGARPLDMKNLYNPSAIRPMSELVRESNEFLLSALRSQVEIAASVADEMREEAA
jgi:hypothetical protein